MLLQKELFPNALWLNRMSNKRVNKCVFDYNSNQYKTQEMCDRVVFENTFL